MKQVDELLDRLENYGDIYQTTEGPVKIKHKLTQEASVLIRSLIRSQQEEMERQFNFGYVIACCNLTNLHDQPGMAFDVLEQLGISRAEVRVMGLGEYDTNALRQIERYSSLRKLYARGRRARTAMGREG